MPGFNFEVERDSDFRRKKPGRGRLFLLFCIVAAVTAVVIWAILPKKEKVENGTADKTEEKALPDAGEKVDGNPGNEGGKESGTEGGKETAEGEKTVSGESGSSAAAAENGDNNAAAGEEPGTVNEADKSTEIKSSDAKFDPSLQELFNHTRAFRQALTGGTWKNAKYAVVHAVAPGDTLAGMARKYRTTAAFIQRYNNIKDPKFIQINQKIALLRSEGWQVTVSRKQGTMKIDRIVDKQAVPFAVFNCQVNARGVKRQDLVISHRMKDPAFTDAQGRKFEARSEGNPYGEFLITVARAANPGGAILPLSIHGCGDPAAVEKSVREGAVVLNAEDIALFYLLIPEGSPVKIVD